MTPSIDVWATLRAPFPAEQIHKLPKPFKRDSEKGRCNDCGGWHGLPAAHLDYVGHAEVTDRLLKADPLWNWEPMGVAPDGLPAFSRDSQGRVVGLWIRLTIAGVTRLGYGSVDPGVFDAEKQLIGDSIRNAAMRFGVALDLWAKSDLHSGDSADDRPRGHMAEAARDMGGSSRPTSSRRPPAPAADPETGEIADAPGRPLWSKPELSSALNAAALTMADLSPVLGAPVTRENYPELIDGWMFAHPGKTITDLISAAVAHHMGADGQHALLGTD